MKPVIRNVRRRLYDALNVMIAADVIEKTIHQELFLKVLYSKPIEDKTSEMIDEAIEGQ